MSKHMTKSHFDTTLGSKKTAENATSSKCNVYDDVKDF